MNAQELFTKNGKGTGVFFCGKCRRVHKTCAEATQCCVDYTCHCGAPRMKSYTLCEHHYREKQQVKEADLWAKAKTLTYAQYRASGDELPAPVFDYGGHGNWDGHFTDMDDLMDYFADQLSVAEYKTEIPEYVFATKRVHHRLDIEGAIENMCCDGYEDMEENIEIPPELEEGLRVFHEVNARALTSFEVDYSIKIEVPRDAI